MHNHPNDLDHPASHHTLRQSAIIYEMFTNRMSENREIDNE